MSKKPFTSLLLSSLITLSLLQGVVSAQQNVKLFINSEELISSGQSAFVDGGAVYVPAKTVLEKVGVEVIWDNQNKVLRGNQYGSERILITPESDILKFDNQRYKMDTKAIVRNGTLFIPSSLISVCFGYRIEFDPFSQTIQYVSDPTFASASYTLLEQNIPSVKPNVTSEQLSSLVSQQNKAEKGSVSGSITWQYNQFLGTKPDVGASVYLIPKSYFQNGLTKQLLDGIMNHKVDPRSIGLYHALVDGFGQYEISNVAAGEYNALVISSKTTRNKQLPFDDNVLTLIKPLLIDWDSYQSSLGFWKHHVQPIKIEPNQRINLSYDFGYTYF